MGSAGCAKTGSLTERAHHHHLHPQCVSHNDHASTAAPQHYSAAAFTDSRACFLFSFLPSSPRCLSAPPLHSTVAGQVSAAPVLPPSSTMRRLNHHSFILKPQERARKVFLCVLCFKGTNWNYLSTDTPLTYTYENMSHALRSPEASALYQEMCIDFNSDVQALFSEYHMPVEKHNTGQTFLKKEIKAGRQADICIKLHHITSLFYHAIPWNETSGITPAFSTAVEEPS